LKSTLRIFSWILLIVISIAGAIWLRPTVDLTWQEPLRLNANEIEVEAKSTLEFLGVNKNLLEQNLLVDYSFNTKMVESYADSLKIDVNNGLLSKVIEDGQSIVQWKTALLEVKPIQGIDLTGIDGLYKSNGIAQIGYSTAGKVIKVETKEDNNVGLIQGTSIEEVGKRILAKFGYDEKDYNLLSSSLQNEVIKEEDKLAQKDSLSTNTVELVWNNSSPDKGKPGLLRMILVPALEEDSVSRNSTTIKSGFSLKSFDTESSNKVNDNQETAQTLYILLFVGCSFFLLTMVFISGLIPVIKGRVDWRKALFIFLMVAIALIFWRAQYIWRVGSTSLVFSDILLSFINPYFTAALIALYTSMAYIGWSNLARDLAHPEIRLVNEFWLQRFKFKETGLAAIQGIGLGFVLVLGTLVSLKLANAYMFNFEGVNFGVTEPESFFPPLTIVASAWSIAWIAALGQIGVITDLLQKWVKSAWVAVLLSVAFNSIIGVFFLRMYGTNTELEMDFLIFFPSALLLVLCYKRFGIVTLSIALFTFTTLINLFPFIQPAVGIRPASTAVILISLIFAVFVSGVYMYKKAPSVEEEVEILPEYELRYQTQERVVREIEVARQTQMQLMPTTPPRVEGVDLYGFFMPSFEVGGDYYYYYKLPNEGEEQLVFTVLDVSGKAMRAAIQAVFTSGLIMSRMNTDTPDDILDEIAPLVHEHTDAKTFITCIVGRYDAKLRSLNFANAGHCMPLLKRGDTADFLETVAPKFPLGMRKEVDYKARTVQLEIGDVLLLYSDGFPEAENRKRDRIGFDGVKEMMTKMDTTQLTAREIGERIKKRIIAHSGQQLADDTTVIVMKIVG
jgi:serine phosphatase RsbU (regulator of sigma subunit)